MIACRCHCCFYFLFTAKNISASIKYNSNMNTNKTIRIVKFHLLLTLLFFCFLFLFLFLSLFFRLPFGFLLHFDMIMRWNGIMLFRFIFDLDDSSTPSLSLSFSSARVHYRILIDLRKKRAYTTSAQAHAKWLISIIFRNDFICPSKCKTHLDRRMQLIAIQFSKWFVCVWCLHILPIKCASAY